jgi:hypothetical protein
VGKAEQKWDFSWAMRIERIQAHHVEGNDILEGDLAIFVLFDETFVNEFRAASCRETKDEGLRGSGIERLDTFYTFT